MDRTLRVTGRPPSRASCTGTRSPASLGKPVATYAPQPIRPLSLSSASVITSASKPTPIMTTEVSLITSLFSRVAVTRATSIGAVRPVTACSMAVSMSLTGIHRLRASRLPVPIGTMPSGIPVPASTPATVRTVPSPPTAITSEAPSASASLVCATPLSSTVVCHSRGLDQPRVSVDLATRASMSSSRSPVFDGLTTTAHQCESRGGDVGSSGTG